MPDTAQPIERKLAAIFAADVAGYSRLMGQDEVATLRTLAAHREIMDRLIGEHRGRIANTAGDSVLAEFPSVVDAVQCAVQVQQALAEANEGMSEGRRMRFRIGVHVGDVMVRGADLLGDGVNVAARLQTLANPGGVCLSGEAHQYTRKLALRFEDLGHQTVRNIEEPIRAYRIASPGGSVRGASSLATASTKLPPLEKASIAVLAFTNMSGDPEQEYFADGITEDIITSLSRIRSLPVISRNSSFTFKGQSVDVRQVGQALGARYVLEGSIRKAGRRLRITGQLVDASSGAQLWGDRFEGDLADVFELQDRVTESVVLAVEPSIKIAEIRRAQSKPTESLDAYDLYLRALAHHFTLNPSGLQEAIRNLRSALEIDPNYARAKALAGLTCNILRSQGLDTPEDTRWAIRMAREALEEGRDDPITLATAAQAVAYLDRGFDAALAAVDRALSLSPHSAIVHGRSGWTKMYAGEASAAIDLYQKAISLSRLDPDLGYSYSGLAFAYLYQRRFAEALEAAERSIGEMPRWVGAWRAKTAALSHLGRITEAQSAARQLLRLAPNFSLSVLREWKFLRDDAHFELLVEGLRMAGVPE